MESDGSCPTAGLLNGEPFQSLTGPRSQSQAEGREAGLGGEAELPLAE